MTSTLKVALAGAAGYPCHASIDGEELDLHSVMFAVQNGPTYGGGFRICPAASPFDGLLDICYNTYRPNLPHLLALLVLAVFSNVGQAFARFFARINRYPASLVVTSLYAFTDELHQYFVPGRNATVMDWLFDTFGALAVLWIVYVISAKIKKRADRNRVFP